MRREFTILPELRSEATLFFQLIRNRYPGFIGGLFGELGCGGGSCADDFCYRGAEDYGRD